MHVWGKKWGKARWEGVYGMCNMQKDDIEEGRNRQYFIKGEVLRA